MSVSDPLVIHELLPEDLVRAEIEPLLRGVWEVVQADAALRPYDDSEPWESFVAGVRAPRTDKHLTRLVATRAGIVVGVGDVCLPLLDNPHLAELGLVVHPDHRRTGVGTRLLAEQERRAAATGRTSWTGGFPAPLEDPAPAHAFAARHGYDVVSGERLKCLTLDPDGSLPAAWAALGAEVAAHAGAYRIEPFDQHVAPARVEGFCALLSRFHDEIPLGELDLHDMAWDAARLAEHEARMDATQQAWFGAVALDADDTVVAFTELALDRAHPVRTWVGGTLVLPEHRGHRLGLAVKLASHTMLRRAYPGCTAVLTGNADVNAPMNAVNERLGYVPVERWVDVQKRVVPT